MLLIRSTRLLVLACIALSVLAGAAAAAQPSATGSIASTGCGSARVNFKPEGSGGAMGIRATKISCEAARRIVTRCVKGEVSPGWTVVTDRQTLMTKGSQRITYTPVGGGGCGAFVKACEDFSYRGVGFFGMHVLGPTCAQWTKPGPHLVRLGRPLLVREVLHGQPLSLHPQRPPRHDHLPTPLQRLSGRLADGRIGAARTHVHSPLRHQRVEQTAANSVTRFEN